MKKKLLIGILIIIIIANTIIELIPIGTLTGVLFMVVYGTFNWGSVNIYLKLTYYYLNIIYYFYKTGFSISSLNAYLFFYLFIVASCDNPLTASMSCAVAPITDTTIVPVVYRSAEFIFIPQTWQWFWHLFNLLDGWITSSFKRCALVVLQLFLRRRLTFPLLLSLSSCSPPPQL